MWRADVARALRPYGLTPPQFFIMMSIFRQQAREGHLPTQKQAAAHTAMDLNVASQVTRKLVARKLVVRSEHPADGRAYGLSLTPTGQALATEASAAVRACNEAFFAGVDQPALAKELQKLTRNHDD